MEYNKDNVNKILVVKVTAFVLQVIIYTFRLVSI